MLRYHIKIYRPNNTKSKLKDFIDRINMLNWQYSAHVLDNLKYRVLNINDILNHIKNNVLTVDQIFEHYEDYNGNILKVCYRIKYSDNMDIIIILSADKKIITIYLNDSEDLHYTLKSELYNKK